MRYNSISSLSIISTSLLLRSSFLLFLLLLACSCLLLRFKLLHLAFGSLCLLRFPSLPADIDDTILKAHKTTAPANTNEGDTFYFELSTRLRFRVKPRPGLAKALLTLHKHYIIYVLTAGSREYAYTIIEHLKQFLTESCADADDMELRQAVW